MQEFLQTTYLGNTTQNYILAVIYLLIGFMLRAWLSNMMIRLVSRIFKQYENQLTTDELKAHLQKRLNFFILLVFLFLAFNHLDDWLAPRLNEGAEDIGAEVLASEEGVWEPVGTLEEYLAANLQPRALSFLDADARARSEGARLMPDLVVGAGATLGRGARLHRAVVWDGEQVPAGFRGENGVFAGGAFHASGSADPGLPA